MQYIDFLLLTKKNVNNKKKNDFFFNLKIINII